MYIDNPSFIDEGTANPPPPNPVACTRLPENTTVNHANNEVHRHSLLIICSHLFFFVAFCFFGGNFEFRQDGVEKIKYTTASEDSPAVARS